MKAFAYLGESYKVFFFLLSFLKPKRPPVAINISIPLIGTSELLLGSHVVQKQTLPLAELPIWKEGAESH